MSELDMTSSENTAVAPFLLELRAAPAEQRRRRLVDLVAERTREILLAVLPDALAGHRLAGSADDCAAVQAALAQVGASPLLVGAFAERPQAA